MKITIGAKICLLTTLLVLATAWFVANWVLNESIEQIIEHEVVDLADETELAAQRMQRSLAAFRSELFRLARTVPDNESVEDILANRSREDRLKNWRKAGEKWFQSNNDLLQAEIWAVGPDGKPTETEPIARIRSSTVGSVSEPTTQADLLKAISNDRDGETIIWVSDLGHAELSYRRDLASSPSEAELPADGRKLTLQSAIKLPPEIRSTATGEISLVLVGTLHLRALDSDLSDNKQLASSPRHFLFVATPDGKFLQHPHADRTFDFKNPNGAVLANAEEQIQGLFQSFDEFMDLPRTTEEEQAARERGTTTKQVELPTLQAWYGYSEELPAEMRSVFDLESQDEGKRQMRREFKAKLYAFLRERPEYRSEIPTVRVPRFRIRSLSPENSDLLAFQAAIDGMLKEVGIPAELHWNRPAALKNFAVHQVRLPLATMQDDKYVDLAVAVSREEMQAETHEEVKQIGFLAALASGGAAALLAVLFSLMITRPLHKIITSTKRLGKGDFDVELPVSDRGEIGELAQSFEAMVGQIRERNRNLEKEREKVQQLNEILKAEKDLLEDRVNERTEELRKSASELEAARDAALEANRAKSAFLAQMSHELRTPLNAIIGYGELLVEDVEEDGNEKYTSDLLKIIDGGKHLLALINDILDLSKIEAGKMELYYETFEVKPMVESVVSAVEPLIKKNFNRLEWMCDPAITTLHADRTRVRQVLFNLLSNACKFTEKGEIHLAATLEIVDGREFVAFAVTDSGIGITPEQLQKLFQNFQQADASTTRKYGGTGLGLAITKRFTEMMGGEISVTSEYGSGSTFTVRIPVRNLLPGEPALPADEAKQNGKAGIVLVIDDDASARDLIKRYLSKEGFHIVTASGGEEGIEKARELQPAFITLDVMMPSMDGWDVLSTLKADPQLCQIPVVMMTMIDDKNLGIALGAADYMTKPIDRDRLTALASRYRNPAAANHAVLVVEDDESTRKLIGRILEGSGWDVTEAENGKVALEKLSECKPALILLDLMMPIMDGFSLLSEMRKRTEWSETPVVVITAKELTTEERSWLNGEVRQVLQKGSYSRDQLLEQVRKFAHIAANGGATGKA